MLMAPCICMNTIVHKHARTCMNMHAHKTRNMKSVRAKSVVCMHACKHDIVLHKRAWSCTKACTSMSTNVLHQSVHDRAWNTNQHEAAWKMLSQLCACMHEHDDIVHYAQTCTIVHKHARTCTSMHKHARPCTNNTKHEPTRSSVKNAKSVVHAWTRYCAARTCTSMHERAPKCARPCTKHEPNTNQTRAAWKMLSQFVCVCVCVCAWAWTRRYCACSCTNVLHDRAPKHARTCCTSIHEHETRNMHTNTNQHEHEDQTLSWGCWIISWLLLLWG
jgi:hypothetical protein